MSNRLLMIMLRLRDLIMITAAAQLLCSCRVDAQEQLTAEVQTSSGEVRGLLREIAGQTYSAFLGVPFAAPPVGERRFLPPQEASSWDDVYNATRLAPLCPQIISGNISATEAAANSASTIDSDVLVDEDCLYLNIFVAGDVSANRSELLPVMVFIHGGGLAGGGASTYDSALLVTQTSQPVIVVVIQYRLGMLGFFTTGDSHVTGNAGFLDQLMALQWTRDNIAAFGGDAQRVTLFGESAGAQSVIAHLVSPLSAGLFHRAIIQSSPVCGRYPELSTYHGHYFNLARSHFNCTTNPADDVMTQGQQLLACLQATPWQDFLLDVTFTPVIDGVFFTEQPRDALASGRFNRDIDVIIGFTNDDGLSESWTDQLFAPFVADGSDFYTDGLSVQPAADVILDTALAFTISEGGIENRPEDGQFARASRNGVVPLNSELLHTLMRSQYTDASDDVRNARLLLDAQRDSWFVAFSLWTGQQMAHGTADVSGSNVYVYSFNHRSEFLGNSPAGGVQLGAPHAHELLYVFGAPLLAFFNLTEHTVAEALLARSVMHTWTTFAATGAYEYMTIDSTTHSCSPAYSYTSLHDVTTNQTSVVDQSTYEYIRFDVGMSSRDVSVGDLRHTYQPRADFWNAVDALSAFPPTSPMPNDGDDEDSDSSSSSSEEFETDALGLDEFEADVAIILLAFGAFVFLIATTCLCCYVTRKESDASKYVM